MEKDAEGAETFFGGGEHGWLFVVVEVTCFGRLLDDSAAQVVCVFCAHNDAVCCAVMIF